VAGAKFLELIAELHRSLREPRSPQPREARLSTSGLQLPAQSIRKSRGVDIMTQRLNPYTVAPDGVAALVGVENYLQKCGLDHKLIALVKTRVSQINGCAYCLHMHTEEARKLGESEVRLHLLDAWHESSLYSARERAALAWAESLTNIAATHAPDQVYEEVRRQFSEKEVADLSIAIAMINAWNRLAIGVRSAHPADLAKAA
jgi:AhpD family alkylhydroperoxidase